ncbi:MAG: TIGR02266 family protein [bacterium]|nr:TIGR02266 family protein [bacterium]
MSSSTGSKADRRHSERAAIKIPVDYSGVDAFFSEFASNINEGGLFIETESPVDLGEVVSLLITLPTLAEPVQLEGRCAWISDGKADSAPGMGVEFLDMSGEIKDLLDKVVRQLRRD